MHHLLYAHAQNSYVSSSLQPLLQQAGQWREVPAGDQDANMCRAEARTLGGPKERGKGHLQAGEAKPGYLPHPHHPADWSFSDPTASFSSTSWAWTTTGCSTTPTPGTRTPPTGRHGSSSGTSRSPITVLREEWRYVSASCSDRNLCLCLSFLEGFRHVSFINLLYFFNVFFNLCSKFCSYSTLVTWTLDIPHILYVWFSHATLNVFCFI